PERASGTLALVPRGSLYMTSLRLRMAPDCQARDLHRCYYRPALKRQLSGAEVEPDVEPGARCRDGRSGDVGESPVPAGGSGLVAGTFVAPVSGEGVGMLPAQERVIGHGVGPLDVGEFGFDDVQPFGPAAVLAFRSHFGAGLFQ